METQNNSNPKQKRPKWVTDVPKKLSDKIKDLFTLEEVEVTFTKVGNTIKYSYTKVHH